MEGLSEDFILTEDEIDVNNLFSEENEEKD